MNFDAVLFDCDGVLVDSEPITNGVLRGVLEELLQDLGRAAVGVEFATPSVTSPGIETIFSERGAQGLCRHPGPADRSAGLRRHQPARLPAPTGPMSAPSAAAATPPAPNAA